MGDSPNWSQLLNTPISFLPSRRATISFSIDKHILASLLFALCLPPSPALRLQYQTRRAPTTHPPPTATPAVQLTISQIQQLRCRRKHLRRQLLRRLLRMQRLSQRWSRALSTRPSALVVETQRLQRRRGVCLRVRHGGVVLFV